MAYLKLILASAVVLSFLLNSCESVPVFELFTTTAKYDDYYDQQSRNNNQYRPETNYNNQYRSESNNNYQSQPDDNQNYYDQGLGRIVQLARKYQPYTYRNRDDYNENYQEAKPAHVAPEDNYNEEEDGYARPKNNYVFDRKARQPHHDGNHGMHSSEDEMRNQIHKD